MSNTNNNNETTREIKQGLSGSGHPVYIVQTTLPSGKVFLERFDNLPEAEAWIKWA